MIPYALSGWLFLLGLYGIVISRNLIHAVMCLSVVQSSTYVLLLEVGYRTHASAPIFKDLPAKARVVDPIVQALALTDIVIGVAVAGLLLALAVQVHKAAGTLDPAKIGPLRG
jgi:multicomponent Na+:H+ antiporter subunit C